MKQPPKRKRGRPPKLGGATALVAFRLPVSLLRRVDGYASRCLRIGGQTAGRSDAVRYLLEQALQENDRKAHEFRSTFRQVVQVLAPPSRRRRS